jgi:CTP-dependent riboflavin kinase
VVEERRNKRCVVFEPFWPDLNLPVQEPTTEELEIDEKIEQIERRYRCNDRQYKSDLCYPAGPDFVHIFLTPLHERLWASAWVSLVLHIRGLCHS